MYAFKKKHRPTFCGDISSSDPSSINESSSDGSGLSSDSDSDWFNTFLSKNKNSKI